VHSFFEVLYTYYGFLVLLISYDKHPVDSIHVDNKNVQTTTTEEDRRSEVLLCREMIVPTLVCVSPEKEPRALAFQPPPV
jgi:hypothetical protein